MTNFICSDQVTMSLKSFDPSMSLISSNTSKPLKSFDPSMPVKSFDPSMSLKSLNPSMSAISFDASMPLKSFDPSMSVKSFDASMPLKSFDYVQQMGVDHGLSYCFRIDNDYVCVWRPFQSATISRISAAASLIYLLVSLCSASTSFASAVRASIVL